MIDRSSPSEHVNEVDTALLDVELFIKYKALDRALARLRTALQGNPRSIVLRERTREICITQKENQEAARQCLALASLYVERDEYDSAYDRLLEAKHLDPRLNIAGGLEAIRRARRPDLEPTPTPAAQKSDKRYVTLAGDLAIISVFDAIQVLENARLTGSLVLTSETKNGRVLFNGGTIVDAEVGAASGGQGFRQIVEITNGSFEFHRSQTEFPTRIEAASNTNLILDTLRQLDEEKQ